MEKITIDNYFDAIKGIPIDKLPADLKDSHQFMVEAKQFVGHDKVIDDMGDLYIEKLNSWIAVNNRETVKPEKKSEA